MEASRDFDKFFYFLILERLQPANLDNRYTFRRGTDKAFLYTQRLFFPPSTLKVLGRLRVVK